MILHEAGHTFGLRHDSTYDTFGVANAEYGDWSDNIDYFHGLTMGEHDGALATYNNWHAIQVLAVCKMTFQPLLPRFSVKLVLVMATARMVETTRPPPQRH